MVPNLFPLLNSSKRIALIGEAPGRHETEWKRCPRCGRQGSWDTCYQCRCDLEPYPQPFVGPSGNLLSDLLVIAGHARASCFLGNVSQHRPPDNRIDNFPWNGEEITEGLELLKADLERYKPNVTVLLGNVPLKAALDPFTNHPLVPRAFKFKNSNWRGSLFIPEIGPLAGLKCLSTYHPAFVLRDYTCAPYLAFDLKRAVDQSLSPLLETPTINIKIAQNWLDIVTTFRRWRREQRLLSIDIEGGIRTMSCISFSEEPHHSFVVPFIRGDRTRVWDLQTECYILRELALLLEDPKVRKIWQNGLYDRFVLQYGYNIRVQGNDEDTMLKAWELNSEIEKGLGVLTSIYTLHPYYKGDRKSQDDETFYRYCGKDSAVTYEICVNLDKMLTAKSSQEHYRLNRALLNPVLYMELRGISYDYEKARARRLLLEQKLHEAQARLNALTGHCLPWTSFAKIAAYAQSIMFTVKGNRPYKDKEYAWTRFNELSRYPLTLASIGEIEDLLEVSLNVDSTKQFNFFLYERLQLPPQYNENKVTHEKTLTSDYEALLKLSRHCKHEGLVHGYNVIQLAIEIRALRTRATMLEISPDKDGRIRCGYNLVGSDTGRVTCYTSPTGSGYNLQTIPNYTSTETAPGKVLGDRDLFLSDRDFLFFQCDLAGADGWTVACYCAMLGDPTMLEDYKSGIRPFERLTLKILGKSIPNNRAELRTLCKTIDKDSWERFAAKRVQHGGSYLEGPITVSRNILKDSEGKLALSTSECKQLLDYFFAVYPGIKRWHSWIATRLGQRPVLTAASGQVRRFYGRRDEILTKAVAFEPQCNTTYATNLAMFRLWTDPENRTTQSAGEPTLEKIQPGSLRVEPLHQVHDALCGQFRVTDTTWAASKIKSWFDNEIVVAGQAIVIPYDGGYGPSWGSLKMGKL